MKRKWNFSKIGQAAPAFTKQVREQTAEDIGNLAQQLAPVDTGELRDSKGVEHADNVSIVGFRAKHAPFVEFGTADQPAQPFLTPASHQLESTYIRRMREAIENAVKQAR